MIVRACVRSIWLAELAASLCIRTPTKAQCCDVVSTPGRRHVYSTRGVLRGTQLQYGSIVTCWCTLLNDTIEISRKLVFGVPFVASGLECLLHSLMDFADVRVRPGHFAK